MYNTAHYGSGPGLMAAVARHAEECGFESFYAPEHIVLYPGASFGRMTFPPDLAVADPLDCLAYVAAVTSELLLGTSVLLLPYHLRPPGRAGQAARDDRRALWRPDEPADGRPGGAARRGRRHRRRLHHPRPAGQRGD
ncbi:MAG TPA: LLM class flavin-dependent oxidoreductase [Streptosporangiaceae bacterium]|jgi:alkanesulfonate monooxygenase SsuD/methylene tetrahydromethanopterin reductase-like flavin-dependent oxidoreductase (luciferase family)